MTTFGLICEGPTDQEVIENILTGYFKSPDIQFNPLQPLRDKTDQHRAGHFGGWQKVFEYCASEQFKQKMGYSDYLVIHIDTDVSEEIGYDIPKLDEKGQKLPPEKLVDGVVEKLISLIGREFFACYKDRIIFAIAVHSTECWLLPLFYNDGKKSKMNNCLAHLKRGIGKKKEFRKIDPAKKNPQDYEKLSKPYQKHKTLIGLYEENPSLKIFIENIKEKNIQIEDDDF